MNHPCCFCGKPIDSRTNYCNWECSVGEAKRSGGKQITPNNLPIRCILADGTMLECEHGDHKDYKFPVDVVDGERHALIYEDGRIAITLYEYRYYLWRIRDGSSLYNPENEDQFLTEESLTKIRALTKP